jgi:hypothetical protein
MHIVENRSKQGRKIYHSVLLRESYREEGKVRKRTIANLSACKPEEIAAIKLALSHKDNLSELGSLKGSVDFEEGLAVGAAWTVYQLARRIGIERALGNEFVGKLALWQVIARVLVFQQCGWPRSMPSATCWPLSEALTKMISMRISGGWPITRRV